MVRHGETDWNREDRFQGHSDPPLNDRGRSQARALAQALGGLEAAALYSSPLARAHETAIILAERLPARGADAGRPAGGRCRLLVRSHSIRGRGSLSGRIPALARVRARLG